MVFHSATFLVSVAVLVALYWLAPWQRVRLVLLFTASLVFYGWKHWPSVFLLLGSIGANYVLGLLLERRPTKALLAFGISLNVSFLLYFKYLPRLDAWAPLGISFFTFQVVAYLVDVYRREIPAERDLLVFAVFKSFFAQLVAGPIVRGREFLPQLREKRSFDAERMHRGAWLILCGLFLKVAVADVIGEYVDFGWRAPTTLGFNNAWLVTYGYAAQLLADFWGYSTMAVGLGHCFGLALPINFDNPYGAASVREFWRRWHITLSSWFRDYVFIPLGGNRRRASFNRLVTMAIAGLWHGAGWNFVLWGSLHGVWMEFERALEKWPRWLRLIITFHVVVLLWLPFRAPSMDAFVHFVTQLFTGHFDTSMPTQTVVLTIAFLALQKPLFALVNERSRWELALAAFMTWFLLAYGSPKSDFIYYVF